MNNLSNRMTSKTTFEDLPATTQYITFELSDYLLAIPSREILKIVATPPQNQGGLVSLGLVQLGPYSIQILDLSELLALKGAKNENLPRPSATSSRSLENRKKADSDEAEENPPFLVVLQGAEDNLWGIALREPPDLMEVPDYAFKPIPAQKRLTRSLRWVSHIASYDLNSDRHSLLILDLSTVLSTEKVKPPVAKDALPTEIQSSFQAEKKKTRDSEMYA